MCCPSTNFHTEPKPRGKCSQEITQLICALPKLAQSPNHSLTGWLNKHISGWNQYIIIKKKSDSTVQLGWKQSCARMMTNQNWTSWCCGWRGIGCEQAGTHGSVNKGQVEQTSQKFRSGRQTPHGLFPLSQPMRPCYWNFLWFSFLHSKVEVSFVPLSQSCSEYCWVDTVYTKLLLQVVGTLCLQIENIFYKLRSGNTTLPYLIFILKYFTSLKNIIDLYYYYI